MLDRVNDHPGQTFRWDPLGGAAVVVGLVLSLVFRSLVPARAADAICIQVPAFAPFFMVAAGLLLLWGIGRSLVGRPRRAVMIAVTAAAPAGLALAIFLAVRLADRTC